MRLAALSALQDRGEIVSVALNSDFKDTGIAAVERLDDRADLEQVVARGKNSGAVKRARTILREMDERAAAEAAAEAAADAKRTAAPRRKHRRTSSAAPDRQEDAPSESPASSGESRSGSRGSSRWRRRRATQEAGAGA